MKNANTTNTNARYTQCANGCGLRTSNRDGVCTECKRALDAEADEKKFA